MSTLLVIGAINTDLIAFVDRAPEAGETVAGGTFEQHGGGKAANQAVSAARSGAEVSLLSAVGADDFGKARLDALDTEGIDCSGIRTIEGTASGVAIIIVEANGENRISDLPGAREQLRPDDCTTAFERVAPSALLSANELSLECQLAIFELAKARSIPVWFNVAPFSPDVQPLIPYVDTLIVNRGEAEDILGLRGDSKSIESLAAGLRKLGAPNVIITLGSDGVQAYEGQEEFRIPCEPVHAIDTTGAGDTFCGAWTAEMLRGASFRESLEFANRAAAISVTRRGAQSSIPTRAEVESGPRQ